MKIGRITTSDRASAGIYADRSGPEIENVLRESLGGAVMFESAIVPDEIGLISAALKKFADELKCDLIVTTGGGNFHTRCDAGGDARGLGKKIARLR
jgi:molybdopterin adenylyltransferase